MKKYRIDYEENVAWGSPIAKTVIYTYDDEDKSGADALIDFYTHYDVKNMVSITFSEVWDGESK